MGLVTSTVTTFTVICDNCGDSIYSGSSEGYDPTKTFNAIFSATLGEPATKPQLLCAGSTCAHNCADALRQAFNGLTGRTAPALPPFTTGTGPTTA